MVVIVGREEVGEVVRWAEGIERVHECIAGRFRRPEPRRRSLEYLKGLLSSVERKNGWQLAEQAGDATPYGVQHLLSTYVWDADLVRDDLRDYVVEHLGDADGVLVVDETGFLKKGSKSVAAAVQRHGGTGRELPDRSISPYATAQGRTLAGPGAVPASGVGRRPGTQGGGWGAGESGVPYQAATGPMLERAVESGVQTRFMAMTTCGCGWSDETFLTCWLSRAMRSCGL